eukprot:gene509-641_t
MDKIKPLLTVLQTDLRTISQEARSKFPLIKEASERGILKLKYLEEQSTTTDKSAQSLAKSEDVLKPFLLSCETKNQKMISVAIGSILKLISHSAVSLSTLPLILSKMAMLIDVGSEEAVQLKVLQGLLILITTLHDIHDDNLAQCLVLCFKLHGSKNTSIQSTSSATLPQIIRIIFDRVLLEMKSDTTHETLTELPSFSSINQEILENQQSEDNTDNGSGDSNIDGEGGNNNNTGGSGSGTGTPNVKKSEDYQVQADSEETASLSTSTTSTTTTHHGHHHGHHHHPNGETTAMSSPSAPLSPSLGNRPPASLKPYARDAYLLLQDLCHITGGDNPAWLPPTTTISRAAGLELIEMIISVHTEIFYKVTEADVLLTKTIKMIESDNPLWMQVLSLESIRIYSEDPNLLRMFYTNYDKDNNAAKIFEISTSKNRCFDLLWQTEPPQIKESYIISVCTECINGIVNAVSKINNPGEECDKDIFPQMANSSWVSVLAAISMLLSKAVDEALIQIVLKALQSFTNTCGELHLSGPRDALLTCLCKTTVPQSLEGIFDQTLVGSSGGGDKEQDGGGKNSGTMNSGMMGSGGMGEKDGKSGIGMSSSMSSSSLSSSASLSFYPTIKNILSVKILLNIAHCMGSVLDEAWILVLETLETWDKVLEALSKIQQPSDGSSPIISFKELSSPRIGQSEIPILINSMNNLFKSSSNLDSKSIKFLLDALGKLCTSSLLSKQGSVINMFSLYKLYDTTISNLYRIDQIWDTVSHLMIEASNHRNPSIRKYGVESISSIIKAALLLQQNEPQQQQQQQQQSQSDNMDEIKFTRLWDGDKVQLEFFKTIEDLTFSTFNDTREKALESIYQILSSSGHTLTTAWPILLSILLRMSQNNEKIFIPIAFQSLELICNEFLSNLSPECLALTIQTIESFVSQKSDINISLTSSSGLLSDLTYFLANENSIASSKYHQNDGTARDPLPKEESNGDQNPLSPRAHSRNRPSIDPNSPYFTEKKRTLINRMWLCSFTSMKNLCIDPRPAIRNGVIVSLFQTLTTYVHLLEKDLLDLILWTILFPLIEEVKSFSEKADQERIDSDLGGGVMLLVHHSRNTAQKQWDETQVLSIGGIVRVFKTFFEILITLESFKKAWESLLNILESESKSSSKEVAMASLSSLHEIVNSNIIDPTYPELTESVWEVLLRLSSKLTDPTAASPKSLSIYIKVFLDFFTKTKSNLDHNQMLRVFHIIFPLGLYIGDSVNDLSNPQVHTLQLIKSFPPVNEEIFPSLISILLKYISIGINYQYSPSTTKFIFPPITISKDLIYYSSITEKSIDLVCELFLHSTTTNAMKSSIYEDIIKVFDAGMLTKYSKYYSNVWKLSVSSLIKLLPSGLLAINEDSIYLNDIKRNIIWTELIDSIQTFILHERPATTTVAPEKKVEEDRFDIELINAISKEMVGFSGIKVERVSIIRDRLVEILQEGSMLSSVGREKVSQSCYQNMFSICSKATPENPESIEIAKVVLPVVLKRCRDVLQKFVVDDRHSGAHMPLPRHRLSEISFILREIKDLELQSGIYQGEINCEGKRPHLLELFTILSDCICTSEREIKELLKNIFYIIANEFLNIKVTIPSSSSSSK